jgi:DNA-binding transcriptional LysR family regulator
MRPTARAEALREPLRQALEALERTVAPASPFDPATASHTWRVAAADYGESTILLPAIAGLRSVAPDTRLAIVELIPSRIAKQAEQGLSILLYIPVGTPLRDCIGGCFLQSAMCWQAGQITQD